VRPSAVDRKETEKMTPRGKRILMSCAAGCGAMALLAIGSCVSFVWWINRPGELLEPAQLRGEDTTAYVEWTLRLEDPGTRVLVEDVLASLRRMQDRASSPLPPAVDNIFRNYQNARNEKQMRQIFPCVVAWSLSTSDTAEDELHLLTVSVEKLGNRLVFADWMLALILRSSRDLEVVPHRGEKIYHVPREGTAFFMRRSDFFLTTDLETARRAVDRLQPAASESRGPGRLDRMLEEIPPDQPLRGAATNKRDELRRIMSWLVGADRRGELQALPWDRVSGVSLGGGFTKESSFEALLDVFLETPGWSEEQISTVASTLSTSLSVENLPVVVEAESLADRVRFRIGVEDLPALLEQSVTRFD
jgi:hypothetical protein